MAKPLVFSFGGQQMAAQMSKVDRSKLYGTKETEMLDEQNKVCELATLAADGWTVIGRGGTATGYMTVEGHWCDRTELTPVDLAGEPIEPVLSSFEAPVSLVETIDINEYLNYEIRSVYALTLDEQSSLSLLIEQLQRGTIFRFQFSFRGGLEAEEAFLLMNDVNDLFMVIGSPSGFPFIGLQPPGADEDQESPPDEDADPMDFEMF